ncbi:MAG TPA: glycosyltransferase family 9 protein [Bacteroidia bacterium]|nr:glycosyltransferase family 9 protein [Bacteroidia bacterium]HNT79151.1 glycosyltransferase family 9 protein [Bacteroidia bacterium]
MNKVLVIQTSFIGDVILSTALLEQLYRSNRFEAIDILVRKGNESLFKDHPFINEVIVWDKKNKKIKNLLLLIAQVRKNKYAVLINLQRFLSTGLISLFSKARTKVGYDKNPLSLFYQHKAKHIIGDGTHETQRNAKLTDFLNIPHQYKPKLYTSNAVEQKVHRLVGDIKNKKYCCIAPASVWFTKQLPFEKWIELCEHIQPRFEVIYILGSSDDYPLCERIAERCKHAQNLSGKLNLLESAYLMSKARMNYVNDSAPLHLASAVNAPVTAFFCSTVPQFGFGPLSDESVVVESDPYPACKPCGLHGLNHCPEKHFSCGNGINITAL